MSATTTRKRKRAPPSSVHQSVPPPHLILPTSTNTSNASAAPPAESSPATPSPSDPPPTSPANPGSGSPPTRGRGKGNGKKAEEPKNPDDVKIREMEVDDLFHVWRLGESIFDREKMANLYRTWDPYCVTELFNTDSEFCLVAEVEDTEEIIGFSMGTTISKKAWKYGYLEWLGVALEWQRYGIARKLFDSFRQLMQKSGARILIIDTQADNIPALRFFEKIGFSNPHSFVYLSKAMESTEDAVAAATPAAINPAPAETAPITAASAISASSSTSSAAGSDTEAKSPAKRGKGRKRGKKQASKPLKDIVIRNLELWDVSKVFHLGEKIFTAKEAQSHYRNWDEFTVVDFFNGDPEFCCVATLNEKVVGFCLGTTIQKSSSKVKYGYITWIGVQANLRRRGIGTQLYNEIYQRMVKADVKALLIDTQADNKAAISFFTLKDFGNPVKHVYLDLNLKKLEEAEEEAAATNGHSNGHHTTSSPSLRGSSSSNGASSPSSSSSSPTTATKRRRGASAVSAATPTSQRTSSRLRAKG